MYDATSESENNEVQSDRGDTASNQFPPDTPPTPSYQSIQAEADGGSPLEHPAPLQQQQEEELPVEDKHPEGVWQGYNGESDQEQHASEGGGKGRGKSGAGKEGSWMGRSGVVWLCAAVVLW